MKINHVFIEKTWIFCLLYTFFSFWRLKFARLSLKFWVLAEFKRKLSGKTPVKIRKICFTAVKNNFLQWKYGKWKYAFYFINISQYFISKYIINVYIFTKNYFKIVFCRFGRSKHIFLLLRKHESANVIWIR
jgi:hypothetical protein